MQLEILFVLIVLLLTVAAWSKWLTVDKRSLDGGRKILFVVGLCAASLALLEYCFFGLHVYRIGGFGDNFASMLKWARPGLWVSLFALVFVMAGRGKSRLLGLASSLLLLILWIIPVWGM
jgi:hypothetical protein